MAKLLPLWFLRFVSYSFLGWSCETIYCSLGAGHFVNRGFLSGPVCPVYGFGALAVLLLLNPVRDNLILVFILGMIVTSVLEYITAWVLETLFHTKWWDYSHYRFHIHRRVCLINSLMFGVLSVVAVKIVDPVVEAGILMIPNMIRWALTIGIGGYFVADTIITSRSILALNGKLAELQEMAEEVHQRLAVYRQEIGERLQDDVEEKRRRLEERMAGLWQETYKSSSRYLSRNASREEQKTEFIAAMERLSEHLDELEKRHSAVQDRLLKAFPSMRSVRHPHAVEKLRSQMNERLNEKKRNKHKN